MGDFVNVLCGIEYCFYNVGVVCVCLIFTFTLVGIEKFFEETFERVTDFD